jgi:D-sedoheptulose 7-phosphate isomerase
MSSAAPGIQIVQAAAQPSAVTPLVFRRADADAGEMVADVDAFLDHYRRRVVAALAAVDMHRVRLAVEWLRQARDGDRQVFICGNGGSAATASHLACDLVKGASLGRRRRLRVMALTDSMPTVTAYANDVGYDRVFVEHLRNFARSGDLLIAISGSGRSPNVVAAVEYANRAGCRSIGLTGRDGGELGRLARLHLHVPEPHMGRIEDVHMAVCHMLAYAFIDAPTAAPTAAPRGATGDRLDARPTAEG